MADITKKAPIWIQWKNASNFELAIQNQKTIYLIEIRFFAKNSLPITTYVVD